MSDARHSEKKAQEQLLQRHRMDLDRMDRRLEMMYNDRLDGRIDVGAYDQKASEIRTQQQQIRRSIETIQSQMFSESAPVSLPTLTDKMAELFLEQSAAERRRLLRLLIDRASWKQGHLQVSFREPFETLRRCDKTMLQSEPGAQHNAT